MTRAEIRSGIWFIRFFKANTNIGGRLQNLHGALRAGFIKRYGYTSDEEGIRHAILEEQNVGFDEAKYMAVSCSAFVNYLISKAENSGLLKKEYGVASHK